MSERVSEDLAHWTIDAILRRWPGAARVFLRQGMACVGCPMASFETVAEAAREYHVELNVLLSQFTPHCGPAAVRKKKETTRDPIEGAP